MSQRGASQRNASPRAAAHRFATQRLFIVSTAYRLTHRIRESAAVVLMSVGVAMWAAVMVAVALWPITLGVITGVTMGIAL